MAKIGIDVRERESSGAVVITPASIHDTGILFQSERGLPNKAVRISNEIEDSIRYGRPRKDLGEYGQYIKKALFKNAESYSVDLYCERISKANVSTDTSSASVTSYTTRFEAKVVGTSENSITLTIAAGSVSGKKYTIVKGATTELFDNVTTSAILVEAINKGKPGVDFNNGLPSALIRVVVASLLPDTPATAISFVGGTATVKARASATATATPAVGITIKAGQFGEEDPGIWGNRISFLVKENLDNPLARNIEIYETDKTGINVLRETFEGVTAGNIENIINVQNSGSKYVMLDSITNIPDTFSALKFLTGGSDGSVVTESDYEGNAFDKTGLYAFDETPIKLLTTDLTTHTFAQKMEEFASTRRVTVIVSSPFGAGFDTLQNTWSTLLLKEKSVLSAIRGWVKIDDGNNGQVSVPAVGHVIGTYYIRQVEDEGGSPHRAPAGENKSLRGVLNSEFKKYNDADLTFLTKTLGFNAVVQVSGKGFTVASSRTFSANSNYYHVHIRRSLNFLADSIESGVGFLKQAPNNGDTRETLENTLKPFLGTQFNRGMFEKDGGFDNNVKIEIFPRDPNFPRDLNANVTVNIVEAIESAIINLIKTDRGFSVTVT